MGGYDAGMGDMLNHLPIVNLLIQDFVDPLQIY